MANYTVLETFSQFFVYETYLETGNDGAYHCKRRKIAVEQEVIIDGAIYPTYIVRYPDNSRGFISKDMYSATQEEADSSLLKELYGTRNYLEKQMLELAQEHQKIIDVISELRLLPKQTATPVVLSLGISGSMNRTLYPKKP